MEMPELDEFAEALFGQLSVETGEEKEIAGLAERIREDPGFDARFEGLEEASSRILPAMREGLADFAGLAIPEGIGLELAGLEEFKRLKGRKVFAAEGAREYVDELFQAVSAGDAGALVGLIGRDTARYFVYSTYAIQYISKISTTYGDYLDSVIYLNKFVLASYPQIILYRRGAPYAANFDSVNSGYMGALKMTILEELVHSGQGPLHAQNKDAAMQVNAINEELARIVLDMDDRAASSLYEYMQLQTVPDDFPIAKRANLFFMLNPDNFIVNVLGPDVMTYTKIEIDPKISGTVPELEDIYRRWLGPIQAHHAAFTVMEGMAQFIVERVLGGDADFQGYLSTFAGTDVSAYKVRKSLGKDFTEAVYAKFAGDAFGMMLENPPTTRELKEPGLFLARV